MVQIWPVISRVASQAVMVGSIIGSGFQKHRPPALIVQVLTQPSTLGRAIEFGLSKSNEIGGITKVAHIRFEVWLKIV